MRVLAVIAMLALLPVGAFGADPPAPEPAEPQAPVLAITLAEDRSVTVEGVTPGAGDELHLLDRARQIAGTAPLTARLGIATEGVPNDLAEMANAALDALALLIEGQATIDAGAARLTGIAPDAVARNAALVRLSGTPWQAVIDLALDRADPYLFSATKNGGEVSYQGHAPDEETAARLEAAIDAAAGLEASGELTLARGEPAGWADTIEAGLGALMLAKEGTLEISGTEVALTAAVTDQGAHGRIVERLGTGWSVDLSVLDPAPEPEITLVVAPDGRMSARGRLPAALGADALGDMLGSVDVSDGLTADGYGNSGDWSSALDALAIAAPRLAQGEIYMTDGLARFQGALQPGFIAADLAAALRTTLGPRWEIGIELSEAPPESHLDIIRTPDGVDIDGILPDGVTPERLLAVLGEADTSDMTGGGEGSARDWQMKLRLMSRALQAFETGRARIDGESVALTGTLAPGYRAAEVTEWLQKRLGDDWEISIEAEDRPGEDGDRRIEIATGIEEELYSGRWQPVQNFEPTPQACRAKLNSAARRERITFVAGHAEIDRGKGRVLDRLASVIRHCLEGGLLALEVEGHTDDRGDEAENLLLSEARALSVVLELAERGVPVRRLRAVGYGESQPVADNETEEGRAANRRIEFRWDG